MIEENEINSLILLCKKKDNYNNIYKKFNNLLDKNKINNNELIKKILKYIIDKKTELISKDLLKLTKYILHSNMELDETINYFLNYLNVILLAK